MLPAVCSMLTQLTCLECTVDGQSLGSLALPSWLTRLTNLQRLECQGGSLGSFPSRPLDLPRLEHLVSWLWAAAHTTMDAQSIH